MTSMGQISPDLLKIQPLEKGGMKKGFSLQLMPIRKHGLLLHLGCCLGNPPHMKKLPMPLGKEGKK